MKRKILTLLICLCFGYCFLGCGEPEKDNVNRNGIVENGNRFVDTGDEYVIGKTKAKIYYDSKTNIVYINQYKSYDRGLGLSLSVMYNEERQPMTIEEYNKSK